MIVTPAPYSHAWLRLPVAYVAQVAEALGARVLQWWDDPYDPRDATVRLVDGDALVWDEETGWRHGRFVSGEKGVRTRLEGIRYLGGGVLPRPADVVGLLDDARYGSGTRLVYRSFTDLHDGFDADLASYAALPV
ncbi:hypothetical protein GCM10009530_32080 [Microbispora corallina]|uniref:DUF6292 domain-containing protein n=1 Tax=Microbispora corallina TaxID=83302 RepID=A0ABQ4G097_9ACTN|nr:DUF6292 family protein [Microbispora corallina]GIH40462.1 hypothetical protein Mco01_34620 [Microbispora corallina]